MVVVWARRASCPVSCPLRVEAAWDRLVRPVLSCGRADEFSECRALSAVVRLDWVASVTADELDAVLLIVESRLVFNVPILVMIVPRDSLR